MILIPLTVLLFAVAPGTPATVAAPASPAAPATPATPAPPAAPTKQASAVFDAFIAAWNAHDVATAVTKVDDDASFLYVLTPVAPGAPKPIADAEFRGKEEFRGFLADGLDGFHVEVSGVQADIDRITAKARVRAASYARLGFETLEVRLEARVRDGRITAFIFTVDEAATPKLAVAVPADSKALVRRFTERVNRKDMSALDDIVSERFIQHSIMPVGPGQQGLKDFYKSFSAAFPDFEFTIEDIIAEGDRVFIRMTSRYTHRGEYMGVPATGKAVTVAKMDVFRVVNGKVVEHWDSVDRLGLLQQLGVVPKLPEWTSSPGFEGFR